MSGLGDFAGALAAAIAPAVDRARAAQLLDVLFKVASAADARALLQQFAQYGQRAEWAQYNTYAGKGWTPDRHDGSVVRKAEFAIARRDELGARGLLALDGARSAAIAQWADAAGILPLERSLAILGGLLREVAAKHDGWSDLAAQLRLAYEFVDGAVSDEQAAAVARIAASAAAWPKPAALAGGAPEEDDDEDEVSDDGDDDDEAPIDPARPSKILAMQLTVDCPGCGDVVSPAGLVASVSCVCGTAIALAPADWAYFFDGDARKLRRGAVAPDDAITNDFGERFFSRRFARPAETVACACGATFATPTAAGELACACGGALIVREADERALAISKAARLVVERRAAPAADAGSAGSIACAACDAALPAGTRGPIAKCPACGERTHVPVTRAKRAMMYLVVG